MHLVQGNCFCSKPHQGKKAQGIQAHEGGYALDEVVPECSWHASRQVSCLHAPLSVPINLNIMFCPQCPRFQRGGQKAKTGSPDLQIIMMKEPDPEQDDCFLTSKQALRQHTHNFDWKCSTPKERQVQKMIMLAKVAMTITWTEKGWMKTRSCGSTRWGATQCS